jgi:hypothetical protein
MNSKTLARMTRSRKRQVRLNNLDALPQFIDEFVLYKNEDCGKKNFDFLQQQNKEIENDISKSPDAFFLPIDDFKDPRTKQSVDTARLPYETIDVKIF